MTAKFAKNGHQPSRSQRAALEDLVGTLEKAALGSLAPAVYLSDLPAGTGTSTALQAYASALCVLPQYGHVGMLIACQRLDKVRAMAEALGGHRDKLCVIVGKLNPE